MSVYSGFTTRLQETAYNQLLEALLKLLQDRILSHIRQEPLKPNWNRRFFEVFYEMTRMESSKYLPPKLSVTVKDLADILSGLHKNLILPEVSFQVYDKQQSFSARSLSRNLTPISPKSVTPSPPKSIRPLSLKDRNKRRGISKDRSKPLFHEDLEWRPNRELSQRYYSRIMLNRLRFGRENGGPRLRGLPNSYL